MEIQTLPQVVVWESDIGTNTWLNRV